MGHTKECCCCCSDAKSCPTLCDPMDCSTPGFPVFHYLPKFARFMSIESGMLSNHLIFCCPLLLLPSILPSIRVFPYKVLFIRSKSQSLKCVEGIIQPTTEPLQTSDLQNLKINVCCFRSPSMVTCYSSNNRKLISSCLSDVGYR